MATAAKVSAREKPRARFDCFAAEWREKSRFMSNVTQMAMLQPYQKIIGMGPEAVPLILEELRRQPAHWFWALQAITLADPVPEEDRGNMDEMAAAWVQWGIENGYLPE